MIYLIITTCIHNRFGIQNPEQRKQEYCTAITETLSNLPNEITPIIVENNGLSSSYLDGFIHNQKPVHVVYTINNLLRHSMKGMTELLDIKDVIEKCGIALDDMIIKITGRYTATSPLFFKTVMEHPEDAFVKFFNVTTGVFHPYESVLGMFAVRCSILRFWSHLTISHYSSAEVAFAYHVKKHAASIHEIEQLDMECVFADTGIRLRV